MSCLFPIEFLDPTVVIAGKERCSKLLKPDSALYRHLDSLRKQIEQAFPGKVQTPPRIDLHIEVITNRVPYSEEEVLKRCAQLQGQQIDASPHLLEKLGKAVMLPTPEVDGYGGTHITLAWFPGGVPDGAFRHIHALPVV